MKTDPEIPLQFLIRMSDLLGSEFPAFREALQQAPGAGLRINTLKIKPAALRNLIGDDPQSLPWTPYAYLLPKEHRLGRHPYHAAGLFYLQDPSAMAVTTILDPRPGERVLDLAAAPGGKATHICASMQNRGLLVANDIHKRRALDLAGNLERWGARNAIVTCESPDRLADHFGPFFDRVLVDAPCSGEGLFRKNPPARREWSPAAVKQCALRQTRILEHAVRLVRPGGWLAYSTCTYAPEENESVVARLLEKHPDFRLVQPTPIQGLDRGRPEWVQPGPGDPLLEQAVRIWPHRAPGEGHFIALFQRQDGPAAGPLPSASHPPSTKSRFLFEGFQRQFLQLNLDPASLVQRGKSLYKPPEGLPDLGGLRVVHEGWWLGEIQPGRFEPSHWLATGLQPGEARYQIDFEVSDPRLRIYLRGGSQRGEGDPGWVLATVDGFPIGWAKRSNGRIKSRLPRGLRLLSD